MSRKSQAFADGQVAFSWKLEAVEAEGARFKATCKNKPDVFAFGDTEQQALKAAEKKLTVAIESGDMGMKGPGQL